MEVGGKKLTAWLPGLFTRSVIESDGDWYFLCSLVGMSPLLGLQPLLYPSRFLCRSKSNVPCAAW